MFESKQCHYLSQLCSQWLGWTRGKDSLRLNSWNPRKHQNRIFLTVLSNFSGKLCENTKHVGCCNTEFPQEKASPLRTMRLDNNKMSALFLHCKFRSYKYNVYTQNIIHLCIAFTTDNADHVIKLVPCTKF